MSGTVTFTARPNSVLVTTAQPSPATALPVPVTATLDSEGYISRNGSRGVYLLASNDPSVNPTNFTYNVSFSNLSANGVGVAYPAFDMLVEAGEDTDITLSAPVSSTTGVIITKGDPGSGLKPMGTVSTYSALPNNLQNIAADIGKTFVADDSSLAYSWDGTQWRNMGYFRGPASVTIVDNGDGTTTFSGTGVTDNGDGTFTVGARGSESVTVPLASNVGKPFTVVLQGDGIDATGVADSRPAVQALIDAAPANSTIVNPSGAILRLNGGLTFNKPNTRITGSGEWRFRLPATYGNDLTSQHGFMDIRADNCWLDGVYVTNPDAILNYGIFFIANYGKATNNTLVGFGSGIHLSPAGEFHDFLVHGNHIIDLLGRGGGSADTTSVGEDYGDGIMCWGANATITGNVISCKDGYDARIGIHTEGLNDQALTPWVHDHSMVTIVGNTVRGKFRRGITSEQVHHTVITSNVIADATWWSIAAISSNYTVIANNTILYTRTANDNQGNYWNPSRSAIMIYNIGSGLSLLGLLVTDNTIEVPTGATCYAGIQLLGNDGSVPCVIGGRIAGNRVRADGALSHGIYVQSATDLEVDDNRLVGFTGNGIYLYSPTAPRIRRNSIVGPSSSGASTAVWVEGGTALTCDQNVFSTVSTGVYAVNVSTRTSINGNVFDTMQTGIQGYGSTVPYLSNNNIFTAVSIPRTNLPSGAVLVGNSV